MPDRPTVIVEESAPAPCFADDERSRQRLSDHGILKKSSVEDRLPKAAEYCIRSSSLSAGHARL